MTAHTDISAGIAERLESAYVGKKLLILDYDGTLAYLAIDWASVRRDLERVACSYGFQSRFSPLWDEIARFRDEQGEAALQALFRVLARHEEIGVDGQRPRSDVVQAVQTLIATSGMTAVVLSLNLRHTVETGLRKLGLQSISAVVGADNVRRWKPDPQGVNELLARAAVQPSEAVFVGDSQRDAGAAAAAGISFLRV